MLSDSSKRGLVRILVCLSATISLVLLGGRNKPEVVPAANVGATPKTTKTSFEKLQNIDTFAFGGIYEAGIISEGEIAFRSVLVNSNALEKLTTILTNGSAEAKLYALCGIRKLSPSDFDAQVSKLNTNVTARTMNGCLVLNEQTTAIQQRIRAGFYDTFISDLSN